MRLLLYIATVFMIGSGFAQARIKSFYFELDQSVPTPYSQNQLNIFKKEFNTGKVMIYEICAYTDSVGSPRYNDSLARLRLNFVTQTLGIPHNSSITLKPYGLDRRPEVTNVINWRRVDIYYGTSTLQSMATDTLSSSFTEVIQSQDTLSVDPVKLVETKEKQEDKGEIEKSVLDAIPYILNIEFIEGTAKMEESSHREVQKLYEFLSDHPELHILIRGHVCCGNNMRISKSRARTVYHELIKLGIEKERLDFVGMSNKEPLVYPEKTNSDRQKNRRVDVKFILPENK